MKNLHLTRSAHSLEHLLKKLYMRMYGFSFLKSESVGLMKSPLLVLLTLSLSFGAMAQSTTTADFSYFASCNTVVFTDLSTATSGLDVIEWSWFFGDGSWSSDQNPVHNYASPGTYTVNLCVLSDSPSGGIWDSACVTKTVDVVACDDYNEIKGLTYWDGDGDGSSTSSVDVGWAERLVKATPGPYYGLSSTSGNYSLFVPAGTYTVEVIEPAGFATTEPIAPYSVTFSGLMDVESGMDFGLYPTVITDDMSVTAYDWAPPVPGFGNAVGLSWSNEGTNILSGSVSYTHDPSLSFISATPAPDSYTGGVLTWNYSNLFPGSNGYAVIYLEVPTTAIVGDFVTGTANVEPLSSDVDPADNTFVHTREILASYDPNDKAVVPAGTGVEGAIPLTTEWLTYSLRFQNNGTFMATNVTLVDTIDMSLLDMSTFEMLSASHSYDVSIEEHGVLVWDFLGINLPESSLDFAGSQGAITFRIKPLTIFEGMEVNNFADIYFDFNPPVRTNTTRSTYTMNATSGLITPIPVENLSLYPNPATDMVVVNVGGFEQAELCIYAISGSLIHCQAPVSEQVQLDLSGLPAGSYLLKIADSNHIGEAVIEKMK